jgi:prolyl oligopeptidase
MKLLSVRRGVIAKFPARGSARTAWGLVAGGLLLTAGCASGRYLSSSAYPVTPKTNVVEVLHGQVINDPYRWLEDDNAPATQAWVAAQNRVTFAYLARIPYRDRIRARLTELWNFERYGVPWHEGGRYFYFKNDGLQNQSVLYTLTALDAGPRVLLDPNTLSPDGTVALSGVAVSPDGKLLAYGTSAAGSDWQEWHVRDIATGEDLSDHIRWVKFSGASWTKDGRGFYYSRFDEPAKDAALTQVNYFQKLYYHRVGTPQSEDRLVYERPDRKEWGFGGYVTDDGHYLIINVSQGTDPRNRVFYRDLTRRDAPVVELLNDFDAAYNFIDNDGPVFWFHTDLDAPRGRIIAIDTRHPERANWREIIPEAKETLRGANVVNQQFLLHYLKDAQSLVRVFDLEGRPVREIELPGIGTASGFGGKRGDTETFFSFTSFRRPATIYRYDLTTGTRAVFRAPRVAFNPEDYVTRQVFCASKDGTRIPMFITHRRDLKINGRVPTLLYGYGGFNISLTPRFSVANLVWMEMGGVYAQPTLRGGGEYGEEWHQAGTRARKQNVFDDFIAAAEWLIANGYTRPDKLAIAGGSNGGLLVGACMTQRPDLFGVCLPAVGVMDMLRFHKFTIGWAWTSDYGSPDNPDDFRALLAYSPYHNLRRGVEYPATLITTADHDDRVVPAHSFKFAARLQEYQRGRKPVLIRIETKAGHGAGKPTAKRIEEAADKLAFTVWNLHFRPKLP